MKTSRLALRRCFSVRVVGILIFQRLVRAAAGANIFLLSPAVMRPDKRRAPIAATCDPPPSTCDVTSQT